MAITLTQLSSFLAVVRGGSVTAAADELVVTQPSVSSAIAALGRELGCELFERAGRGVRLTDEGAAFVPYAADVIGLLEQGRRSVREAAGVVSRRLRIGAVTTAAESFVPPLMRAFSDQHPDAELVLDVGNAEAVTERLLSRVVDLAISGRPPSDARLVVEPLIDNEIVCITAPNDPAAADHRELAAGELRGHTWLLRERGSGTRTLNERFLEENGLRPRTLMLGSNGAIKQAARAGLGVSLLSRAAVESELAAGQLAEIRLSDGPPTRPWFVVLPSAGPSRALAGAFVDFARRQAGRDG